MKTLSPYHGKFLVLFILLFCSGLFSFAQDDNKIKTTEPNTKNKKEKNSVIVSSKEDQITTNKKDNSNFQKNSSDKKKKGKDENKKVTAEADAVKYPRRYVTDETYSPSAKENNTTVPADQAKGNPYQEQPK